MPPSNPVPAPADVEAVGSHAASAAPARQAGIYGETGSIEPGKRADLVLLDVSEAPDAPPPRVRAVWRAGRMIHSDGWASPMAEAIAEAA